MDKPKHFYNFCFFDRGQFVSVPVSDENENITKSTLKKINEYVGSPSDAVLISVSYLGYMTDKEFECN